MNTSEQQTTSNNLDALIKQAEIMELKIKLDLQFKKNMDFLKRKNHDMYEQFANFKPTKQKLSIDNNGDINLINIPSGKPAYSESPELFADKQVKDFINKPSRISIGFKGSPIINEEMIHPPITNKLLDEYNALQLKSQYNREDPIGLVVMMGCGLGFQIKKIVENHDVRNLFLFDANEDSFYASLHTIDWEDIVKIFEDRKGKLRINVGEDYKKAIYRMRALPYDIGIHNMITTYLFKHTQSEDNTLFYNYLVKEAGLITSYLGFFDDEQISFSHSISCINNNIPVFSPHNKNTNKKLPPVFIIGNGPSLDSMVDLIKKYQEQVIVISCGTSLASLESLDIKPDFHIEMERNHSISQVLESSTSREFMKDITLLSLNTVAPSVRNLFKNCYIAIKPNDIGAVIYQDLMDNKKTFELPICNPTVANCGVSYALNMGFNEIYLLGIDLGMKNSKEHHSKHSFWSKLELEENSKETGIVDHSFGDDQYKVAGNFGDEVITHFILDSSRKNIEILLEDYPNINCYNPNDGAFIKGATPKYSKDITINSEKIDKDNVINELLSSHFIKLRTKKIDKKSIDSQYIWVLKKAKDGFLLPEECKDMNKLYEELNRIFLNIYAIEQAHGVTALLVRGSIQIFSGVITYFCSRADNKEQFELCYQLGKSAYNTLIDKMIAFMENTPLKLDNSLALKSVESK